MTQLFRSLHLLSFILFPIQGRARSLYDLLDESNSLGRKSHYLNLGYWADGAKDLDEAGEAMARLMAEKAKLSQNDVVLDVGFGFADQDLFWMRNYRPKKIVGLNLNEKQFLRARAKVRESGCSGDFDFVLGDAVEMPFQDASFDVVFALESAFHFRTRDRFFKEAYRVLRPGGRLVMVDLTGLDRKQGLLSRIVETFGRSFWQIPRENLYSARVFQQRMEDQGFSKASVESIWHDVYPPFVEFARNRLKENDVRTRLNPAFRMILGTSLNARRKVDPELMDYVLAGAVKRNG